MKNHFLILFHKARLDWNRNICNEMADRIGLTHEEMRWKHPKYNQAYCNYKDSKQRLVELGAFKPIST